MKTHTIDHIQLISSIKEDTDFLLSPVKSKELSALMNKYGLDLDEAVLFSVIIKNALDSPNSVSFDDLSDTQRLPVGSKVYLKWLATLKRLEKKDMIVLEKSRHSSILDPDINIDEGVFSELILGEDLLDDLDVTDIYSIVEYVDGLIDRRSDEKISVKRFFFELERIVDNMDNALMLKSIVLQYTPIERAMVFKAIAERIKGYGREECNRFATEIYGTLTDVARFMELVYKRSLYTLQDKVLIIDEESSFQNSPDFDISDKLYFELFNATKKRKKEFRSELSRHIRYTTLKQSLFFDDEIAKQTNTIAKAASKKEYRGIVKRLKAANMPTGLVSLLYGHPGTGKTATVYEMARLTKRDVLQVDISNIRDKWVGESEKRLKAIFKEYEQAKVDLGHVPILLFNEADALISQRMATSDSVDVMNNTMQNILLEELERFDGIFFATTNLIDNMDDAFDRRFLYKIEFKKPSRLTRRHIWMAKIPQLSKESIDEITHYELTGGQIENVARKYMLDTILNHRSFEIGTLQAFCEDEVSFKQEEGGRIGFAA